jgi:hypothetical protein
VLGAEVGEITAVTDGQTAARPLEQLACLTLRFGHGTARWSRVAFFQTRATITGLIA